MAGVTLPPAGSGRTFPGGCFFRSQGGARQREKAKGAMGDLALLSGRAFLAPMRPLAPEMGQGPQDRVTNDGPRERCLGSSPDSATNSSSDPGPQVPPLHREGLRPACGPHTQMARSTAG